ncbi:MAG: hypothetical protein APF76_13630 [Desulfitibacter sp. BRH_c19]|nr:MAG: hypothetical protein APF76_13630 [Desulfitibacter sp. BRH_c19]
MLVKRIWKHIPSFLKQPIYILKGYLERGKVIYRAITPYNLIEVIDKNGIRYLVFKDPNQPMYRQRPEVTYQSYMVINDPLNTNATYADYFQLALIFNPQIITVLMVGLGGGIVPKRFLNDYPEMRFISIEVDSEVVKVAHQYFHLKQSSRHRILVGDGRKYIQRTKETFDLILLDAFFATTVPYHLFTIEFYQEVNGCLNPNGLLGINIYGALTGSNSYLFRSLYQTLAFVFPRLYLFAAKKSTPEVMQNIFIFALQKDMDMTPEDIFKRAQILSQTKVSIPGYVEKAQKLYQEPIDVTDVPILSDQNSPVNGELNLYSKVVM